MLDFDNIEYHDAKELSSGVTDEIKDNIIHDDINIHMKFYEKLRRKFKKPFKNKKASKISDFLLLLPDLFMLLTRLMIDKRVPSKIKLFTGAMIGYVILPIDIIPDFIPFIGYVDDLMIVVYGINSIINDIDNEIIEENWSGKHNILKVIKKIISMSNTILNKKILNKVKNWIIKKKG